MATTIPQTREELIITQAIDKAATLLLEWTPDTPPSRIPMFSDEALCDAAVIFTHVLMSKMLQRHYLTSDEPLSKFAAVSLGKEIKALVQNFTGLEMEAVCNLA